MRTKIIFQASVWQSYYVEVNLNQLSKDLADRLIDSSDMSSCRNTLIINRELTPEDVVKLIDILKEMEVWNNVARLVINEGA